jgi:hypothetical protein
MEKTLNKFYKLNNINEARSWQSSQLQIRNVSNNLAFEVNDNLQ